MSNDKEQKSELVRQHKRIAQGEKLDGTSLKSKGTTSPTSKKQGGLSHIKSK